VASRLALSSSIPVFQYSNIPTFRWWSQPKYGTFWLILGLETALFSFFQKKLKKLQFLPCGII